MSGSNAGTGQPLWFRCVKCRKEHRAMRCGEIRGVTVTGRTKKARHGNAHGRNSTFCFEYKCRCCGYGGWSRHVDMEMAFPWTFGTKSLIYDDIGFLREVKLP